MIARALCVVLLGLVVACGGPARSPAALGKLGGPLVQAFEAEATGDPVEAVRMYVDALDGAARTPDDPASTAIAAAALDALVHRDVFAFAELGGTSALAARVDPGALASSGGSLDERLARVQKDAEGPLVRPAIARARLALAERRGDAKAAEARRAESGCVREATVFGPTSFASVLGPAEPTPLGAADAPLPSDVQGAGPFAKRARPSVVKALGCRLPLYGATHARGVRDVVVDVDVPRAGWIAVGLRSAGAATLHVAGKAALTRPFSPGSSEAAYFARVEIERAGVARVVARVAADADYATVELGAWSDEGAPLAWKAPSPGARADARAKRVVGVGLVTKPTTDEAAVAAGLGALALGDPRTAENVLYPRTLAEGAKPGVLLAYARAVRLAQDLPFVKSSERARAAYERVLVAWPGAWEAIVEHAVLAGARRGQAEASVEALTDLERLRSEAKTAPVATWLLDAFEAKAAGRDQLYDRARAAFDRAKPRLGSAPLLREVERVAFERTGAEAVAFECDDARTSDRTSLACDHARRFVGDRVGSEREEARLRALAGSSGLYLSLTLRDALEVGDLPRARQLLELSLPSEQTLAATFAVKGKAALPELLKIAPVARDAPGALASVLRAAGDDPLAAFDGVAERVTSEAKSGPLLDGAATAVLAHDERYEVHPSGLVHFLMLDVRRVMGTTDVEANAQAPAPMLYGRDALRVLRRRIFKKDGSVVLPDRTPHAAQSHADLAQLEAGDAVEAIYEGWGLPGESGNVGVDTPDLLPERTAVRDARIELRTPAGLASSLWTHPLLGKPEETREGETRVLVWKMKDRAVRRLEYGAPKMDRNVGVSFSTSTWGDVARGLRETVASLEAESPELTAWAKDAAQGKEGRALVDAVVAASGSAVKEASGIALADVDFGRGMGTARSILATREGSRTWLIVSALRELGVKADVVVAENEPYSDSPTFPPHFGRFMHPLAVARVPLAESPGVFRDVWIDADVPGPPLPAGRISPELRGRSALWSDGTIAPLPALANEEERDEIDQRLVVDAEGNAKGVLTVLLRGRSAQDLAEALARLVGNERQRALRGIALGWVPFATVEEVELSSTEGSWQIAIRAELSAPAYAQVEGTRPESRSWVLPGIDPVHYVFPRPYVSTLSATYATQGTRESALAINYATQYHVRRRVELPSSASVAALPGPYEGRGPLLFGQRKIGVAGNTIEEDFTLEVTTGTVPRDGYETFVAEARRIDDAFRASTRVKPPAP